ncbi:Uma2 family endonuclease [Streptomyces spirodelae]|uniref:Uma2 family endonuclease n=1 Tax=Streptomyces spirodelae TaxID=2812904 RepID=A0ABS3WN49_9ACTN|nr:Uma2 family endonuclease [Streptomyces spirodelae]MBO8184553.1 Uma2 family endonuclease [Streptomyces spirodelae]
MAHEPLSQEELLLEGFLALDTPEGYRAEFIEGDIVVTPPPDGDHESHISVVVKQVTRKSATDMDVSGNKGLKLERGGRCPKNYVIPDATWTPTSARLFWGAEPWMPAEGVAMVAEVTSTRPERDRDTKRHCYALAGIPLYLLVDRERGSVTLFSEPGNDDYQQVVTMPFGKEIEVPAPFSMTLETTDFA